MKNECKKKIEVLTSTNNFCLSKKEINNVNPSFIYILECDSRGVLITRGYKHDETTLNLCFEKKCIHVPKYIPVLP